jgi:hypothetical protein
MRPAVCTEESLIAPVFESGPVKENNEHSAVSQFSVLRYLVSVLELSRKLETRKPRPEN